ncbi:MAG: LamG-like jellyroll fold domain-containing protein, partial [Candidatus Woesearchaeota archaeon]
MEKFTKFIILIYIILSLFFAKYYIKDGLNIGKDGGTFLLINFESLKSKFFYLWETNIHGFSSYFNQISIIFYLILSFFQIFGYNVTVFIYWFLVFFLAFVGSFFLGKKILEIFEFKKYNFIIFFFASLVYIFSPIAVTYRWGDTNSQVFSYASFPLLIYFILDTIYEKRFKFLIKKSIFYSFFISIFAFGFVNITILVNLFLFCFLVILFNFKKYLIKNFLIASALYFLLNFWIINIIFITYSSTINFVTENINIKSKLNWVESYEKTITSFSSILFYPTKLWEGLYAYNSYYLSPIFIICWVSFISILTITNLINLKENKNFTIFGFVLLIVSISLSLQPKGIFRNFYIFMIKKFSFFWAFRTAFDKFNYILQISLFVLSLNFLINIFSQNKNNKKIKTLILVFFIFCMIFSGIPLLTGKTSYDYGNNPTKVKIPDQYLEMKKYIELISDEEPSSWIIFIPSSKGSWIRGKWYFGLDYTLNLRGKISSFEMMKSNITSNIINILESPDFIFDENKQKRFYNLLKIGNYKYVVFRDDINLDSQEKIWSGELHVKNQIMNFMYFAENYNLTKNITVGNPCKSKSFIFRGNNSYIIVNNSKDILISDYLKGEIILRKIDNRYDKGWNIILDKKFSFGLSNPDGHALKFMIFNDTYYEFGVGNRFKSYELKWHNITFLYTNYSIYLFDNNELIGTLNSVPNPQKNENDIWIGWNSYLIQDEEFQGLISSIKIYNSSDNLYLYIDPTNNIFSHNLTLNNVKIIYSDCFFNSNKTIGYEIYFNPNTFGNLFILNDYEKIDIQKIEYTTLNPTLYIVKLSINNTSLIGFSESYDPGWEARVYKDGKKVETVKSIPLYGVINGFWINTTGENLEIVIRYKPQDYFELGLAISGITF